MHGFNYFTMKHLLFKPTPFLILLLFTCFTGLAQNFVWKSGSNAIGLPGTYGTQGIALSTNVPGARAAATSWKDKTGKFWLFGGYGNDYTGSTGYLNDMWKYDPATNDWAWMNGNNVINQWGVYGGIGLYSSSSTPGTRENAVSWRDTVGNLWLFGGYGKDVGGNYGQLNDLWEYNPITNQWRWVKGSNTNSQQGIYGVQGNSAPSNIPGARSRSLSWTDSIGNFWLFGGFGLASNGTFGRLNDLWKFSTATNQWMWVNGSNFVDQFAVYGTLGVPNSANMPGGRMSSAGWMDKSGNLWVIGGDGFSSSGPADIQSDLWKYNVATNQWTWVKGNNNSTFQQGVYGTQNVPASANMPGARYESVTWLDGSGDFWLFSGYGFDTGTTPDYLNDLWRYNIASNKWQWVNGSSSIDQIGFYGVQNIPAAGNIPGSRFIASSWKDDANNLWLFGGEGYDSSNNIGVLNDLWKFTNCLGPYVAISSTKDTVCAGQSVTLTASGANTYSWVSGQHTTTITVSPLGTSSYTIFATDIYECMDTTTYTLAIMQPPNVSISSSDSLICSGETAKLKGFGASTYSWSNTQSGPITSITPTANTTYTVTGTDTKGCYNTASFTQSVSLCLGIETIAGSTSSGVSVYPNPSHGEFNVSLEQGASAVLVILNALGQKVLEQMLDTDKNVIHPGLATGLYHYQILRSSHVIASGKLVME